MNTGRLTLILALVAALGVGFAGGVLTTTFQVRRFVREGFLPRPWPGRPDAKNRPGGTEFRDHLFRNLSSRLGLRPDQEPEIRGLLEVQVEKMHAAENGFLGTLKTLREEADREIAARLDEVQKKKFEAWRLSVMPRRDLRPEGPPPPGDPREHGFRPQDAPEPRR